MVGMLRLLLLFFSSVLLLASCSPQVATGLSTEGWALLSLLASFSPTSPTHKRLSCTWNASSETPCAWEGISCSLISHHVVSLSLPPPLPSSLSVTPPPYLAPFTPISASLAAFPYLEILNLSSLNLHGLARLDALANNCTRLRVIDLSHNNLSGLIPSSLFTNCPHLSVLHLEYNQFSGIIPPEIGSGRNLTALFLHENMLSGSIPVEIGHLSLLQVFKVGGNPHLSGSLPPELGNCSSLVTLGASFTSISGKIPPDLGRLSNLERLALYSARLLGGIPPELGNCSKLQYIYLFKNNLTGSIPKELTHLRSLRMLYLWQNQLSGNIPPELGMLENIEILDLAQNQLTGSIPASFGLLVKMTDLSLSINFLSGQIPRELGNCSKLRNLRLDRNKLTGSIPDELGHLAQLLQLYLWNNSLEGGIPISLANCKELTYVDFSWNKLGGSVPEQIFNLSMFQEFLLVGNELSGVIPASIAGSQFLSRLLLAKNRLTGSIPVEIGALQNLTYIDISNNMISGTIPDSIVNCRLLENLDVHDNRLSGHIPDGLELLAELQYLDISLNLLTGPLLSGIGRLHNLTTLVVSGNSLSGPIPSDLGECQKLTTLDLSSNLFSGTIPPSLGQITTLSISLNICCNNLSGSLPEDFARLENLGNLDVSHNKLSGHLDVLGRMASLSDLDISFNLFSGPLPNASIFSLLSMKDCEGNPGLCEAFSNNGTSGKWGRKINPSKRVAINGFLFGTVALMVVIGSFMLCALLKSSLIAGAPTCEPENMAFPWVLTPFQKLSFTMEDVLDKMVDSNVVGKGSSGIVYRAQMPKGEMVAVKKVAMASSISKTMPQRNFFKTEMETLRAIRHKNIVRLLGICTNNQSNLLLYDFMPNGSLEEWIHKKRRRALDWETRYKIALGAAQGLAYLHHDCMPPIIHRDVKASNILLGAHFEAYLADFGLAKSVGPATAATHTVLAGSYGYIAPEYAYTLTITEKSDVYSYGVLLLEMLTGKRPLDASIGEGRHLTDWVYEMLHCNKDDILDIFDPHLRGLADPFVKKMLQTLTLAMDCVHPLPCERPSMRHIVTLLLYIHHHQKVHIDDYAKLDVLASTTCKTTCNHPKESTLLPSHDGLIPSLNTKSTSLSYHISEHILTKDN